jgi:hypothetical protein
MLDSGDSLQHYRPVQGSWFRPRIPSQPSTRRPTRRNRPLHLCPRRTQVSASPSFCRVAHLPSVSLGAVVELARLGAVVDLARLNAIVELALPGSVVALARLGAFVELARHPKPWGPARPRAG